MRNRPDTLTHKDGYIRRIIEYTSGEKKRIWVKNLSGLREGRITVVSLVENVENRVKNKPIRWKWFCKCDCGKEMVVFANNLGRGHSSSCGCLGRENATKSVTTHGLGHTVEYKRWFAMISRCHNPKHRANKLYKSRKRTVCSRWKNSFESFLEDVGLVPEGLTLERGNNNEGYHCGKCEECKYNFWKRNGHWDTWKAQNRNKENNRYFEYNGESLIAHDWANKFSLDKDVVRNRLFNGWSVKRTIETPIIKRNKICQL